MKARYRLEHELGDYSGQFEFHKICFGVTAQIRMLFQFYILVGISFGMASHNYDCVCITILYDDLYWYEMDFLWRTMEARNNEKLDRRPKTKANRAQLKFKDLFL